MKLHLLVVLPIAAWCLTSCGSGISYTYDWDRGADLTQYATYDWLPLPPAVTGDAEEARTRNDLLDKRIRRAMDSGLAAKGYSLDSLHPAFLIAYHVGTEDKVNVTDWGYRYGPGPWGYYGRDIDVRQYTKGTLIVDFVDAATRQLFWRGEASKTINPNASQEDVDRTINEAIAGLLRNWPPESD